MKACPYCAEPIQEAAVLCKYCRSWLGDGPPPPGIDEPPVHLLPAAARRAPAGPGPVPLPQPSGVREPEPAGAGPASPAGGGGSPPGPRPAPGRSTPAGRGSVGAGIGWMFLLSALLFWLPVAGPLVAGVVGGKKAGGVGNAILAVFLPALLLGAAAFAAASVLSGMALVGAIAGAGTSILVLAHVGPLLIGAVVGGLLA